MVHAKGAFLAPDHARAQARLHELAYRIHGATAPVRWQSLVFSLQAFLPGKVYRFRRCPNKVGVRQRTNVFRNR
jgi:hypothetical protein